MKKLSVLIIDDSLFMRTILKNLIIQTGYCEIIGEGSTGYEAIEMTKTLQPDIITMDIVMPDLDGVKAVKEIKSISSQSKIIMITSIANHKVISDAKNLGVFDYLIKPLNQDDINKIIAKVIDRST